MAARLAALEPGLDLDLLHGNVDNPRTEQLASHVARLVEDREDTLELPEATVKRLGVTTTPLSDKTAPRPLELSGSLAFDPNFLARTQSR